MSIQVESLLAVVGALAQRQAEALPVRERLRRDALAREKMHRETNEILAELNRRKYGPLA